MTSKAGKRVLVVEDDPVVAMVVEDTLRDLGLEVIVDLTLVDALNEIETSEFNAVVIDVGLRGESAHPMMVALQERNVPFVVISGGDLTTLAAEFPQVRMMSKPLDMKSLQQVVQDLLAIPPARAV
jgi:DNA-binding NtrC family response regulator